MSVLEFRSDSTVRLIQSAGGDHSIVAAAKVSTTGEGALAFMDPALTEDNAGLIGYLVRHRHGSPFEHSLLTFFVHAPAMVWWEWVRHRIGFSYSLESGRYKKLAPVFWVPHRERPMIPAPGHKSAAPKFQRASDDQYKATVMALKYTHETAWTGYESMLGFGVANEVARAALGFGVYYSGWVSCNPRSLMAFLSLRVHDPDATFPSFPQWEIQECGIMAESMFREGWPITHAAFVKHGRVGP